MNMQMEMFALSCKGNEGNRVILKNVSTAQHKSLQVDPLGKICMEGFCRLRYMYSNLMLMIS